MMYVPTMAPPERRARLIDLGAGAANQPAMAMRDPANQKVLLAVLAVAFVLLTGWTQSPFLFLLYAPILLAIQRGRALTGLGLALGMSLLYLLGTRVRMPIIADVHTLIAGIALSFPAVAVVAGLYQRRHEEQYHRLHVHSRDLATLLDMSQMMDAAVDMEMTLNLILLNAHKLTNCQVCAVYLKDQSGENLELKAASGPRDRARLLPLMPIAACRFHEWSVDDPDNINERIQSFYMRDTAHPAPDYDSRLMELDRRARSYVCAPLSSVDGFLGMLYIGFDMPSGIPVTGVEQVERLAARVAFALQRVLLQQGFRSLAYTDSKTGLDNFRQFEQSLADETNRAGRYGHRMSVLLIDIDHFKDFNDTHGHQAGDALLAQLAVVLRNCLRSVDRPSRYGGEEFAVVCPETGKEEARLIAERIRQSVGATPFALVEGADDRTGNHAHVTVSIGFATFPQDAHSAGDIVRKADIALYAAKGAGRNAVRGHEDVSMMAGVG